MELWASSENIHPRYHSECVPRQEKANFSLLLSRLFLLRSICIEPPDYSRHYLYLFQYPFLFLHFAFLNLFFKLHFEVIKLYFSLGFS